MGTTSPSTGVLNRETNTIESASGTSEGRIYR